jgi:hypothetical protein
MCEMNPGDILLYRPTGFIGWAIAWRTFSNWAHVEVYVGSGVSVASRNGIGVAKYPLRREQLGKVLRPYAWPDLATGMRWFHAVADGQRYDFAAILRFMLPHIITRDLDLDRQICSAFATRFMRQCGVDIVAKDCDADLVAPSDIAKSATCDVVWSDGKP